MSGGAYNFADGLPPSEIGTDSPATEWTHENHFEYHQCDPSTGLFGILPGALNDIFRWQDASITGCPATSTDLVSGCRLYNELFYGSYSDEAFVNQFYGLDWEKVARCFNFHPIYFCLSANPEEDLSGAEGFPQLMRLYQWTDPTDAEGFTSDNGSPYVALDFDDILQRWATEKGVSIDPIYSGVTLGKWCVSTNELETAGMPIYVGTGDPETDSLDDLVDTMYNLLFVFLSTAQLSRWLYGYIAYAAEMGEDMMANDHYDTGAYSYEESDWSYTALQYEDCEDGGLWNTYVIYTTSQEHGLSPGDEVHFVSSIEGVEGSYIVSFVVDDNSFGILASDLPESMLNSGDPAEILDGRDYCVVSNTDADPLEVYENDTLLTIGIDYLITLDDGATWFSDWPIDSSFNEYYRQAKAGRFYIKFNELNRSSVYWCRYFIYRNQELSDEGLVRLRNGRVIFDESLKDTSGSLQTILISRTNSANPYITSVTTEYSLRVQERSKKIDPDGRRRRGSVSSRESGDSLNVS